MKIKNGFLMREIANNHIVVPTGERVIEFKGMMTLNETAGYIWKCLSEDISYNELLSLVLKEYEIDEVTAKKDLDEFLETCREAGVLEE